MSEALSLASSSIQNIASAGKFLSFKLRGQFYALPIFSVIEINQMKDLTMVPEVEAHVKGVLNLRGKIIPIIDLGIKLGLGESTYTKETCIIVVETEGHMVGAIVDSVTEVIELESQQIEQVPSTNRKLNSQFLDGIGKLDDQVILLIDVNHSFSANEKKVS